VRRLVARRPEDRILSRTRVPRNRKRVRHEPGRHPSAAADLERGRVRAVLAASLTKVTPLHIASMSFATVRRNLAPTSDPSLTKGYAACRASRELTGQLSNPPALLSRLLTLA